MSKLLRYASYYAFVALAIVSDGPPVIHPNDPLENEGEIDFDRYEQKFPYVTPNNVTQYTQGELYVPYKQNPYALVLFMPGFGACYNAYDVYLEHLASHGFLAVGMNFFGSPITTDGEHDDKAQQAVQAIAYVRSLDPVIRSLPIYTAGHSLGGKIAFYAAAQFPEIAGVMALDPVNAGGPPCAFFPEQCIAYPVAPNRQTGQRGILYLIESLSSLIMRSAPDPFANPDEQFNAANFYFGSNGTGLDAAPSPSLYYDFGNYPHTIYIPALPSKQVQIIKRTMLAFLLKEAAGKNVDKNFTGTIIKQDIDKRRLDSVQSR
jgi:pimeloyl-ACP methyl ester carboxylesterase